MTTDPLADLLGEARLGAATVYAKSNAPLEALTLEQVDRGQSDWLRANRDRVLEALGGERLPSFFPIGHAWRKSDSWLFPLGDA